jgi:endonuclease-3 related protein
LRNLLLMISHQYGGELEALLADETSRARANLLSVKGIGPETADAILLYCGNHPLFVVDAYTHRVFSRHGLVPEECEYDELQALFMDSLPPDPQLYNEYHALIVRVGKDYCKKGNPQCERCPLLGVEE